MPWECQRKRNERLLKERNGRKVSMVAAQIQKKSKVAGQTNAKMKHKMATQGEPIKILPKVGYKFFQHPVTQYQETLLVRQPNFAMAPRHPSHLGYITVTQQMCHKLRLQ